MRSGSWRAARDGRGGCARRAASSSSTAGRQPDRSRARATERLLLAAERLEDELAAECRGNRAYEDYREQRTADTQGRRFGRPDRSRTARRRCRTGR